jgi:threonine/homoserine/homoserine lactone efflux protein
MSSAGLLTFAIALLVAAAVPGPGMTAIVARALGSGFRGTLPMMGGFIAGDIAYMSAAALGLAALAHHFETVFEVIRWCGAAYLLYLAARLWRSRPEAVSVAADAARERPMRVFLAGLSLTLGNPKVMVFYLALLPTIIDLTRLGPGDFALMIAVVVFDLTLVIGAYALAADRARRLLARPAARLVANRAAGAAMAGAAVAIVTR